MRFRMIWRGINKFKFVFRNLIFRIIFIVLRKYVQILSVVIIYYNKVLFLEEKLQVQCQSYVCEFMRVYVLKKNKFKIK